MSSKPATTRNVHVIGIGRTGAAYVEALVRTGEIEDLLAAPDASFAALLVDIGEDDVFVPNDYARSLGKRLESRRISQERFHYESVNLGVPEVNQLTKDIESARAPLKAALGESLIEKLPKDFASPKPGEHTPRAVAKALAAIQLHVGNKPLAAALERFAGQVKKSGGASTVLVAFGLAGGTGSGMAAALARSLKPLLPANAAVTGLAQLSHSGDGDYHNSLAQTMAIESLAAATAGDAAANPFPGGLFVVPSEHSWQRLSAYTSTGVREVRQRFKQMVTNRFVADSFMRWAASGGSGHLARVLADAKGKWVLFDVAKLTHPGVQVLPGEAGSKWDSVLQQWIEFVPKFSGLREGFKTDRAEIHVYAARDMKTEMLDDELRRVVASAYLGGKTSGISTFRTEFFDVLTSYGLVILPGVKSDDLVAYTEAKAAHAKVDAGSRALEAA